VAELDPRTPVADLQPMSAFVDRAMATTRFSQALVAVFARIAALLACVGLYGVLAATVRRARPSSGCDSRSARPPRACSAS
jgi:hypothetical protein